MRSYTLQSSLIHPDIPAFILEPRSRTPSTPASPTAEALPDVAPGPGPGRRASGSNSGTSSRSTSFSLPADSLGGFRSGAVSVSGEIEEEEEDMSPEGP